MKGVSKVESAALLVVVLIIVGVGVYLLFQPGAAVQSTSGGTLTSTSSLPPFDARQAMLGHLNKISAHNIPTILQDYSETSVVTWGGQSGGQGGNYSGTGNIRLLYAATLSNAQTINFALSSLQETSSSPTEVTASFAMNDSGTSTILGSFNGTIRGTITFQNVNNKWLILRESWNYVTFNVQNAGGATTFPEWRTVGGPIEETKSPSAFKQSVWDFGGTGTAIFIFAYIFSLAVVATIKHRWK